MQTSSRYYQPSTEIDVVNLVKLIGLGIVAGIILGGVYAYANFYVPLIYIGALITAAFAFGLGYVISEAAKILKVRNPLTVIIAAIVSGIAGLYFAWAVWLYILTDVLAFSPGWITGMMGVVGEEGAWSIRGNAVTGTFLYIVWAIEAVMIVGGAYFFGTSDVGETPFCDNCEAWTENNIVASNLEPVRNRPSMVNSLEAHDMSAVTDLKPVPASEPRFTLVNMHQCAGCASTKFMSVHDVNIKVDDDGNPTEEAEPIVKNLILDSSDYSAIDGWRNSLTRI